MSHAGIYKCHSELQQVWSVEMWLGLILECLSVSSFKISFSIRFAFHFLLSPTLSLHPRAERATRVKSV